MKDRELLEMAAKAAGLTIEYWAQDNYPVALCGGKKTGWNPIVFNSDALRLAVALRMQIDILERSVYALALGGTKVCELDRADIDAATRRAIVRAAAEIGKEQP